MSNKFYNAAAPFFERGLMYEIYSNDEFCICNVANQSYVMFNYKFFENAPYGFIVNSYDIKRLVSNKLVNRYLFTLEPEKLKARSIIISRETLPIIERFKLKNDLNGPSESIDLDMERELQLKYGKKNSR